MLRQISKRFISESIKAMEPGNFQDFCLRFLPIYNSNFEGIIRNGGTADGKTRPGIPDLIKTYPDGMVLAVECGTEKDYWQKPKTITDRKPIKDLESVVNTIQIDKLKEVILCSSQEIPANAANAKTEIIEYIKNQNYNFEIESLSNADFEEAIASNTEKYKPIIDEFFPDLKTLMPNTAQAAAATIIELYRETGKPFGLIESIVQNNIDKDSTELKAIVLGIGGSSFQKEVPVFQGIKRNLDWELLGGSPIGRMIALTGQPKVGKTSLISQFCQFLDKDILIQWFDCPSTPRDAQIFENDIVRSILECIIEPLYVNEYLTRKISFAEMAKHHKLASNERVLFIIDNAENLGKDSLKTIDRELKTLQENVDLTWLGLILISSKSLKRQVYFLGAEYICPLWTMNELEDLLKFNSITTTDPLENYIKVLHPFSNGHPIVALALVKKFPSIRQLLFEKMALKGKPLVDEELSEYVKKLMFEELLRETEDRNLVLCASLLVYPFSIEDLEKLLQNIYPGYSNPIKFAIDRLGGTIFEDKGENKFSIAFVFKEVANDQINQDFKTKIYLETARICFTIRNNKVDVLRICEGINYSLFANDFDKAIYWAAIMLTRLMLDNVEESVGRAIVSRIDTILYFSPPDKKVSLMHYIQAMLLFRRTFFRAGDYEKVKLSMKNYENAMTRGEKLLDPFILKVNRVMLYAYEFIDYAREGDHNNAANALDNLESLEISGFDIASKELLLLISDLTKLIEPQYFPINYYSRAILKVSQDDADLIAYMTAGFISWASKCVKTGYYKAVNLEAFKEINNLSQILVSCFEAQLNHENKNDEGALKIIKNIYSSANNWGCKSRSALRYIILMEADLLYNSSQDITAKKLYKEILSYFYSGREIFYLGWCYKQLGMIEEDLNQALVHFNQAGEIFKEIGIEFEYSKVYGEIGILLFKTGKEVDALNIFREIINKYYVLNNLNFGPATIITVSLLFNIKKNDKPLEFDKKIKNGISHVGFRKGAFANVLKGYTPQAGVACAYHTMAECYRKYNKINLANSCLDQILLSDMANIAEAHCYAEGVFILNSSYENRVNMQLEGLIKLARRNCDIQAILNYGRSLYVVWGIHEPKIIPIWDYKRVNNLVGGARIINSLKLANDPRFACMLLLFLGVAKHDNGEIVNSLKSKLQSIAMPVADLLPRDFRNIIGI